MEIEAAEGIAWNALSSVSKRNASREYVIEGTDTLVNLTVKGTIGKGRLRVSIPIKGQLKVGLSNANGTTNSPNMLRLVSHLIDQIPKTRRKNLVDWIKFTYEKEPDKQNEILAKSLIDALKTRSPRRGAITFEESAP